MRPSGIQSWIIFQDVFSGEKFRITFVIQINLLPWE